jgi:hypothetical protein
MRPYKEQHRLYRTFDREDIKVSLRKEEEKNTFRTPSQTQLAKRGRKYPLAK